MNNPLVSVVIVSYNSSNYILDTLESIKLQSYRNVELIISDDCSRDNTVELCREWLSANSGNFVRSEIVTTDVNTGVSANCNRGVRKAKGDWIKVLAADDLLLPDAIGENIAYSDARPEVQIIFSRILAFGDDPELLKDREGVFLYEFFKLPRWMFFTALLDENFIPAATGFIRKDVFDRIGLFDENIPMLEDWPFWIEAVSAKIKIAFLDRKTVKYRIHSSSLSNGNMSERYMDSIRKLQGKCLAKMYEFSKLLWLREKCVQYKRRANKYFKYLYSFLIYINPYTYVLKYLKHLRMSHS